MCVKVATIWVGSHAAGESQSAISLTNLSTRAATRNTTKEKTITHSTSRELHDEEKNPVPIAIPL
eukprot:scaffold1593_cov154-Skeletonema_dohrnii-CCMP3373.AAC.7